MAAGSREAISGDDEVMSATIQNIVFACPGATKGAYESAGRAIASFYADLLGMRIVREDWFMIGRDDDAGGLRLAFGDGPIDYQPPRWPDPDRPQQLHLDVAVSNIDATEGLALQLGATRLQDQGDYRSYADPIGHPFCLYTDPIPEDVNRHPLSGRIERVVIDCFDPRAVAGFYAELLGMPRRERGTPGRVVIARDDGRLPALAFQQTESPAPRWPDPAYPQQVHLDLYVDDSEAAHELVSRLGLTRLAEMGGSCPVYADPAGHPLCLCSPGQ